MPSNTLMIARCPGCGQLDKIQPSGVCSTCLRRERSRRNYWKQKGKPMVIECVQVHCKNCLTFDSFTSRDKKPARKLAEAAGWRERKEGWICPGCRKEEFDQLETEVK